VISPFRQFKEGRRIFYRSARTPFLLVFASIAETDSADFDRQGTAMKRSGGKRTPFHLLFSPSAFSC